MIKWNIQMSKIRVNILLLEAGLLAIAILCIVNDAMELASVCAGGLIAFGTQILEKDS